MHHKDLATYGIAEDISPAIILVRKIGTTSIELASLDMRLIFIVEDKVPGFKILVLRTLLLDWMILDPCLGVRT